MLQLLSGASEYFPIPALQPNFNATVTGANSVTFPRAGTADPVLAAGDSYWFK